MHFSPCLFTWARFWGVFWVDVSTRTSAEESYSEIAEALGCAKTVDAVRKTLSNLPPTSRWLLILDNADDPHRDYQAYFPSGNRGAILMTSRNSHCGVLATTSGREELDSLEEHECVLLLQQTARLSEVAYESEDYEFAVTLVQHLGHHTLAILQAGSYIATTHCSISEYLDFLRTNRQRLLENSRSQGQSRYDTVYATFGASIEFLESQETASSEEMRRDALQLLEVLSTFHYTSMPLDILMDAWEGAKEARKTSEEFGTYSQQLTAWHVARVPYFISPESNDVKLRITDAVGRLESLALVKTDRPGRIWRSVTMHPLVHGWAGDRKSQQARKEALRMAECIVALSNFVFGTWRPYYPQFAPHLKRLVELDVELADDAAQCRSVLQVCVRIAYTFEYMHLNKDMYEFTCRVFRRLDLDDQKPTVELRELYYVFAMAIDQQRNRPAQAVRAFQAIARLDKGTLPKNDWDRLKNIRSLGMAYIEDRQTKKAVALSRDVVKALQGLGAEDRAVLSAQHTLAMALYHDGQNTEAIMWLEKVVMVRQRLLSEDNRDRLTSQQVLASAYLKDGQIAEATRRLEEVARIYAQTLGEEHPKTVGTHAWLADAYLQAGRFSEAIELYERVVNSYALVLDETHSRLLTSKNTLAGAYLDVGRTQEATDILERVVRISNSTFDDTDRYSLSHQQELARAYLQAGRVVDAVGILERVVGIRKSVLEEKDPRLLMSQQGLGYAYLQAGRVVEAIGILEQVLGIMKPILEDKDPDLRNTQHELGRAYLQAERAVEAIGILEQVAHVESLRYDLDHPVRVDLQELLCKAYAMRDGSFSRPRPFSELSCAPENTALQRVEASKHDSANYGPTVEAEEQGPETSEDSLEEMFSSSLVLRGTPEDRGSERKSLQ